MAKSKSNTTIVICSHTSSIDDNKVDKLTEKSNIFTASCKKRTEAKNNFYSNFDLSCY